MAEIKIEKKKPIWPWIILVLVILALLYFLVFADDDENDAMDDGIKTEQLEEGTLEEEPEATNWEDEAGNLGNQGVEGYIAYVSDESRMGIDHEYTNNAFIRLVDAVQAKANDMNVDISSEMQSIRQAAQKIQQNPTATTHAETIKNAGTQVADVLKKLQEQNYPNLSNDVEEVRTAATNIQGNVQTLNQKDQVNKFFNEAADVLRKMS